MNSNNMTCSAHLNEEIQSALNNRGIPSPSDDQRFQIICDLYLEHGASIFDTTNMADLMIQMCVLAELSEPKN